MRTVLFLLMVSACDDGASNTHNGTITITSPANNAMVTAPLTSPNVPVSFSVSGFTLKTAGTCAGAANCGHVHITVDGAVCNDPNAAGPYNNDGASSPIEIHLDKCPAVAGAHKVTAELHNDDHSTYTNSGGTAVTNSVNITVQ